MSPMRGMPAVHQRSGSTSSSSTSEGITVGLFSSIFVQPPGAGPSGSGSLAALQQEAAKQLGIQVSELAFYELRPITGGELSSSTSMVAAYTKSNSECC